jgi:hypothetical protein
MSEAQNEAAVDDFTDDQTTDEGEQGNPAETTDDGLGEAGKKALDRMKADRAAAVKRAKELEKELDSFKQASMTEAQKAVLEAEKKGRQSALTEYGARLARARFDALAARRNKDVSTDEIVEYVDMNKFLTEDGDVDAKALQAAVDRLVPEAQAGPPSFDGGVRTSSSPKKMDDIIRSQAGFGRSA